MENPEKNLILEQQKRRDWCIMRGREAINKRRAREEEYYKKELTLGKGDHLLADKLESLLTHAEENQGSPESEEILEAFAFYAKALEDDDHMDRLDRLVADIAQKERWGLNDQKFNISDGVKSAWATTSGYVHKAEEALKKIIDKMQ